MLCPHHTVQLKSSDLKARAMHATLQPLRAMLDQAASSLAAPYVLHQVRLAGKVPGDVCSTATRRITGCW